MAKKNRYTPVQQKILGVLLDEKPHLRTELEECLPNNGQLAVHITAMRDILREVDRDIVSRRYDSAYYYQLVYLPYPFPESTSSTSKNTIS